MGRKCIAIIADYLTLPIDEGLKKMTFEMMRYASTLEDVDIYSSPDNIGIEGVSLYKANKLMISREIYNILNRKHYSDIFYIPEASTTFNSFIRAWLISQQAPHGTSIHIVNSQERQLKKWQLLLVSKLKNLEVICFSHSTCHKFRSVGIKSRELLNGVDVDVFRPVSNQMKLDLRRKYKMPLNGKIILHVGHIRRSRNLSIFKSLQKEGFQVVIVGSTSMAYESDLANDLSKYGIRILSEYNPHIEELFQLSDLYIFPVSLSDAAIEFPLSVLEAMACGLPVLTTRFGALPDVFFESSCFGYFEKEEELVAKSKEFIERRSEINRNLIVDNFSWKKVFDKFFNLQ